MFLQHTLVVTYISLLLLMHTAFPNMYQLHCLIVSNYNDHLYTCLAVSLHVNFSATYECLIWPNTTTTLQRKLYQCHHFPQQCGRVLIFPTLLHFFSIMVISNFCKSYVQSFNTGYIFLTANELEYLITTFHLGFSVCKFGLYHLSIFLLSFSLLIHKSCLYILVNS